MAGRYTMSLYVEGTIPQHIENKKNVKKYLVGGGTFPPPKKISNIILLFLVLNTIIVVFDWDLVPFFL